MMNPNVGMGTKAIHAGNVKDAQYGALTTPIYQTSTFEFDTVQQGGARFAGQEEGYIYSRLGNPSLTQVEEKLAALEGGEAALATASGMGAISSALWSSVEAGDEIVASDTLYGCTFALLNHGMTRYGVEVSFVDTSDLDAVRKALKPNTCAVYLETPANPNLKIADISAVAALAHGYNKDIKVICDNTFASPYLQRPLELGADVVVHSATKYLNGHGDVIAGFVISDAEFIGKCRMFGLKDMTGAVMDPFCAFLILRGLKTLEIRMQKHCANAKAVAEFLYDHPAVEKVYYPGLIDHPGHDIARRQMRDFGGMLSFEVKGGRAAATTFMDSLELAAIVTHVADARTCCLHPASTTHRQLTDEQLEACGVRPDLVRLSVGIEDIDDILADLEQALAKI